MMVLLISGLVFALELFIIPHLWDYGVSLVTKFLTEEPSKDSLFRLLEDKDGNIHIQFSNNNGKTYYDYNDTLYRSESTAKSKLDEIISHVNKTEKILFEYNPNRLRITDGSEREFQEDGEAL